MTDKQIIKNIEIQLADRGITISCFYNELSKLKLSARSKGDHRLLEIVSKFMSAIKLYLSTGNRNGNTASWYLNHEYKYIQNAPRIQPMW